MSEYNKLVITDDGLLALKNKLANLGSSLSISYIVASNDPKYLTMSKEQLQKESFITGDIIQGQINFNNQSSAELTGNPDDHNYKHFQVQFKNDKDDFINYNDQEAPIIKKDFKITAIFLEMVFLSSEIPNGFYYNQQYVVENFGIITAKDPEIIPAPKDGDDLTYVFNADIFLNIDRADKISVKYSEKGYITRKEADESYVKIGDIYNKEEIDNKLKEVDKVKTVNNNQPDSKGNININTGVNTINHRHPSADGDIDLIQDKNVVTSIDSQKIKLSVGASSDIPDGQDKSTIVFQKDFDGKDHFLASQNYVDAKLKNAGKVKSVNGVTPDASGDIKVDAGKVKTVSDVGPDSKGNIDLDDKYLSKDATYNKTEIDQKLKETGKVKTVSGVGPDSSGNVNLDNKYLAKDDAHVVKTSGTTPVVLNPATTDLGSSLIYKSPTGDPSKDAVLVTREALDKYKQDILNSLDQWEEMKDVSVAMRTENQIKNKFYYITDGN